MLIRKSTLNTEASQRISQPKFFVKNRANDNCVFHSQLGALWSCKEACNDIELNNFFLSAWKAFQRWYLLLRLDFGLPLHLLCSITLRLMVQVGKDLNRDKDL